MNYPCLTEEQLISLYYQEEDAAELRSHLRICENCQQHFHLLCQDLLDIDSSVPDGGKIAVEEALKVIEQSETESAEDEILTPEEVASWFKVSFHNIMNMLHLLPHFIIDGQIRFEKRALKEYLKSQSAGAASKAPDQPRHNIISQVCRKAG